MEDKNKTEIKQAKIAEEEHLFEIPSSWCWARLNDIQDVRDGTHDTPNYIEEGVPLITSKNLVNGSIDFTNIKYISVNDANKINQRSDVSNGDILFAMIGTIGNPVIVNVNQPISIKNEALLKQFSVYNINKFILQYLLWNQEKMIKTASGGLQKFYSLTMIRKLVVPLPPIEEQKRIVSKIDELFAVIDLIEKEYTEYNQLTMKMDKKILDCAVRGKLVEHHPSDESVSDLLIRTKTEKGQIIHNKKTRKEKLSESQSEIDTSFQIPESWEWVKLLDICTKITDGSHNPPKDSGSGVQMISATNLTDEGIDFTKTSRHLTKEQFLHEDKRTEIRKGDILLSIVGSIGKVSVVDTDIPFTAQRSVAILKPLIDSDFLGYQLKSDYFQRLLMRKASGNAQKGVYLRTLEQMMVVLPPINEQKRIVEEIKKYKYVLKN